MELEGEGKGRGLQDGLHISENTVPIKMLLEKSSSVNKACHLNMSFLLPKYGFRAFTIGRNTFFNLPFHPMLIQYTLSDSLSF